MLSNNLRALRKALNLSQKAFGAKLGVPLTTISKYEQGSVSPGCEFIIKISSVYKVNLNWLLGGDGTMFIEPVPEDIEPSCKKVYYSDGTTEIIGDTVSLLREKVQLGVSKISSSEQKLQFIYLALEAMNDKKALEDLKIVLQGIELAY